MAATHSATPAWFMDALKQKPERNRVEVDSCSIHYKTWGDVSKPLIILVHGNGAHAAWWDFIAPHFSDRYRVAAIDLAGMGDSAHRDHYTAESYAGDLLALARHLQQETQQETQQGTPPLLLGHSLGGRLSFKAVQLFPEAFAGVIMADSPFNPHTRHIDFDSRKKEVKPNRVYQSFEEAKERYRLFPAQPCDNEFILDYIATQSLKQVEQGWTWKFDPKIWPTFDFKSLVQSQPQAGDKILGLIYGERSALFPDEIRRYNDELFARYNFPEPIAIPHAYHHLFLDQPLAFIEAVDKVLLTAYPSEG